jgi:N-acetyl-anhydromuramyl-L-alanine amidase AmpD
MNKRAFLSGLLIFSTLVLPGCGLFGGKIRVGHELQRRGDEIVVCGRLFHTGAPVVLWTDPGGYDAYRYHCKFNTEQDLPSKPAGTASTNRYHSFRRKLPDDVEAGVRKDGWDLDTLREHVDQFVLHYDVCGTSAQCFYILQDVRGLSVHFMLDVDGTIYQTLDLKERAWHAGSANDRSVGIEIANIGAYKDMETLDKWYVRDEDGRTRMTIPSGVRLGSLPEKTYSPSRNDPVLGNVQKRDLYQYDLTDAQYDSLIKLTATLHKALPGIELDYPRNPDGTLRTTMLSEEELAAFQGVIGHYHITTSKVDPGPALDWDRVIKGAKKLVR